MPRLRLIGLLLVLAGAAACGSSPTAPGPSQSRVPQGGARPDTSVPGSDSGGTTAPGGGTLSSGGATGSPPPPTGDGHA
jgi:hypothetical protein